MLENKCDGAELLIRRVLSHNKHVYEKISKMAEAAYKIICEGLAMELDDDLKDSLRMRALNYFSLSEQKDMVLYFYSTGRKTNEFFASNLVDITSVSSSALINELIKESNEWYEKIISFENKFQTAGSED